MKTHWSARNTKSFVFRIVTDFIAQLDKKMDSECISQSELAKKLKVSRGRVSQVFTNAGNVELETIVKFSKALSMKVAIVAYDDNDPKNTKGPIDSELFKICWEKQGKPRDFWSLGEQAGQSSKTANSAVGNVYGKYTHMNRLAGAITKTAETKDSDIKSIDELRAVQ